jgi:hypothetical protein
MFTMSKQGHDPTRRAYSALDIEACLHFFALRTPVQSSSDTNRSGNVVPSPTIEWWPCLLFENMMELNMITEKIGSWSTLPKGQIMMLYMQHLPASATCRVALLLGPQPPQGNNFIQFDIPTEDSTTPPFRVMPFYEKVFHFGVLYAQNEEYLNAVKQAMPLLREAAESPGCDTKANSGNGSSSNSVDRAIRHADCESSVANGRAADDAASLDIKVSDEPNIKVKKKISNEPKSDSHADHFLAPKDCIVGSDRLVKIDLRTKGKAVSTKLPTPPAQTTSKPIVRNTNFEFVEIPTFKDVKKVLLKGGYTIDGKKIRRPPISVATSTDDSLVNTPDRLFSSVSAFRDDLCINGVNCRCGTLMDESKACSCWTEDDKWNIKLWVRYNVIRGPINISSPVKVITSIYQAARYLIKLGFNLRLLESPLTTEEQRHDLFRHLSQYGLPTAANMNDNNPEWSCDYTKISPEERFSLEYFISTNHFRVKTL